MNKKEFLKKWLVISEAYHKTKYKSDQKSLGIRKEYNNMLKSKEAKNFVVFSMNLK